MNGHPGIRLHTFRLYMCALEVYVTGDFDSWSRSQKLVLVSNGIFEKEIVLPDLEKICYRFYVDGEWILDPSAMQEVGSGGLRTNVLTKQRIVQEEPSLALPQSPSYPYKRLDFDSHEIRIITLYQDQSHGQIHGSMSHISLISPGSYNALSYCWGDPVDRKQINLDGVIVPITENLYLAMKNVISLAEREASPGSFKLWVDALCINQADSEERSSQVRNMRQIYSRASRVIAAVGEPWRLEVLWGKYYSSSAVANLVESRFDGNIMESQDADLHSLTLGRWKTLNMFFNEPYWTRVWVIQELTVASDVIILCGDTVIEWEDVAAVLTLWKRLPAKDLPKVRAYQRAMHLLEFRERFSVAREPIRLLDALRWSHTTQATDPRDKIYALLGLCYDGQLYVPIPNYKQPLEVIMADMAKAMMRLDRSLNLICLKGTAISMDIAGPTWLPNYFNLGQDTTTLLERKILGQMNMIDRNPIIEELDKGRLVVRSIFFGHIYRISSAMRPHDGDDTLVQDSQERMSRTLSLAVHNSRPIRVPSHVWSDFDKIWNTLTSSVVPLKLSKEAARRCFSLLWVPQGRGAIQNLELIRWIDTNASLRVGNSRTLREWSRVGSLSRDAPTKISDTEFNTFIESLEQVLGSGMRFFELTGSPAGNMIGMAHPDAKLSDQIHLIHGCSVAVVLRECETSDSRKTYRVIGGAHLTNSDPDEASAFTSGGDSRFGHKISNITLI